MSNETTTADLSVVFTGAGHVAAQVPLVNTTDFRCMDFSGALVSPRRHLVEAHMTPEPAMTLDEAQNSLGEWVGVFASSSRPRTFIVRCDPFAYQTVFYRIGERPDGGTDVYVSTSAPALSHTLARNGQPVGVNWMETLPAVTTKHPWTATVHSSHSFGQDVDLLTPGQFLYVSPELVAVGSADLFDASGAAYDSLLDRGIEKAIRQLTRTAEIPAHDHVLHLSGGKDSRVLMGMLTAAGLTDRFTVSTVNPAWWPTAAARPMLTQDLLLADAMRRRYGMCWVAPSPLRYVHTTFSQSLAQWRVHKSHRDFRYKPSDGFHMREQAIVELRGGAGETFRRYQSVRDLATFSQLRNSREAYDDDAMRVLAEVFPARQLPETVTTGLPERFLGVLRNVGGDTILDTLHRRYTMYRNRGHFGHARWSLSRNALPVMPLSQPEFVAAGALLDREDREAGAVTFDLLERLNPELNDLTFEGSQYSERIRARRVRAIPSTPWDVRGESSDLEEFLDNDRRAIELQREARRNASALLRLPNTYNLQQRTVHEIQELVADLASLPNAAEHLTNDVRSFLVSSARRQTLTPSHMVAKLQSAKDMVVGYPAVTTRNYSVGARTTAHPEPFGAFVDRSVESRNGFRDHRGSITMRITVAQDNGGLDATLEVFNDSGQALEYAFYLFQDGQRVREQWYSPVPYSKFGGGLDPGEYYVRGFVRYRRQTDVLFIQESEKVIVDA